mgnify:CR=1 FL=1
MIKITFECSSIGEANFITSELAAAVDRLRNKQPEAPEPAAPGPFPPTLLSPPPGGAR